MAKARKKASKRRAKAKRNPAIDYPPNWKPSDTIRWAATATKPEIEERLARVRAEVEAPSSDDSMYFVRLMQEEFALNDALAARHPLRKEPKPISGEIIVNPWAKQQRSKKKYRKKRVKNPALVSKRELGYFYEDGIRDFNGSSLVGQNLSGMDLRDAQFRDANLYNVNFSGADLRGVDFRGADLGETDFRGAKVNLDTQMDGANLKGSLGPPDYYEGGKKVDLTAIRSHFIVDTYGDGYIVKPAEGSPFHGQIQPHIFEGVNAKRDALEHARDLAEMANDMVPPADDEARTDNPGKKTPAWKKQIERCQRLWGAYDKKPLKKNLIAFVNHIEGMKKSKSARVRTEARRAMRAYNAELKARGWKKPKNR